MLQSWLHDSSDWYAVHFEPCWGHCAASCRQRDARENPRENKFSSRSDKMSFRLFGAEVGSLGKKISSRFSFQEGQDDGTVRQDADIVSIRWRGSDDLRSRKGWDWPAMFPDIVSTQNTLDNSAICSKIPWIRSRGSLPKPHSVAIPKSRPGKTFCATSILLFVPFRSLG